MSGATLADLQATVDGWIHRHGGYWDELSLLARLTEEVGELAREVNHRYGAKRPKPSEAAGEHALADEMGDLLFILICLANRTGVDLDQALVTVVRKYDVRDAGRWSEA